jgi:hypothetical protein
MAQEPRIVQPVIFFDPMKSPQLAKDYSIQPQLIERREVVAEQPAEPQPESGLEPEPIETGPKGFSVIESAQSSDYQQLAIEDETAPVAKDPPKTTTDPLKPTFSPPTPTEAGKPEQPVIPVPAITPTTGSQDSER